MYESMDSWSNLAPSRSVVAWVWGCVGGVVGGSAGVGETNKRDKEEQEKVEEVEEVVEVVEVEEEDWSWPFGLWVQECRST